MSTAAFVPQDASTLTAIRYYTPFDPYFYSVDNRPLTDIATNLTSISSGGGDSARRAVLISQLALSGVMRELFTTSNVNGFISGLNATYPAANTVQLGPGALYSAQVTNSSNAQAIIKQALSFSPVDFTITPPATAGQSVAYLIQGQYQDLNATTMVTSNIPYIDANNSFLPCLLLNGQLALSLKAGTANTTGSQVTPTPDSGWQAIFVVTATYGVANPVIEVAQVNGPSIHGLNQGALGTATSTGGATTTAIANIPTLTFPKSGTSSIVLPIPITVSQNNPNPYAPLKFNIIFSSDVSGGNFAMQLSYTGLGPGQSTTTPLTTTTIEAMPMQTAANGMNTYTMTGEIPNSAFAGFLNEVWQNVVYKLFVTLSRVSANATDTNTGNLFVHDIIVWQ